MRRKIMAVLLTVALVLGLVGCIDKGNKDNDDVGQTPPIVEVPEEKPEEKPEETPEEKPSVEEESFDFTLDGEGILKIHKEDMNSQGKEYTIKINSETAKTLTIEYMNYPSEFVNLFNIYSINIDGEEFDISLFREISTGSGNYGEGTIESNGREAKIYNATYGDVKSAVFKKALRMVIPERQSSSNIVLDVSNSDNVELTVGFTTSAIKYFKEITFRLD